MKKVIFTLEDCQKINQERALSQTDKEQLLAFFNKYNHLFSEKNYEIAIYKKTIDKRIAEILDTQKANEQKLDAATMLSEKKVRQQADIINTKYDTLKFNNYVEALNKKDVTNKSLRSAKEAFVKDKQEYDAALLTFFSTNKLRKDLEKKDYNQHADIIIQKEIRRQRRLKTVYEKLMAQETDRFTKISEPIEAKINSIKSNKIEYEIIKYNNELLIKDNYTNISLNVNKLIKQERQTRQTKKEKIETDYQKSLLPLERNMNYLEANFTEAKNDISFKYSEILNEINKIYDLKKQSLEKQKDHLSKEDSNSDHYIEFTDINLKLHSLREEWHADIEKNNILRRLEISKQEAIQQTNLKKLQFAHQIKEFQANLAIKNNEIIQKLIVLPYEINREFVFKQRGIHLQIIENENEMARLSDDIQIKKAELELENAYNTHQYYLLLYEIKYRYLSNKLRLNKQLAIEKIKFKIEHQIQVWDLEGQIEKANTQLLVLNRQFPYNQAQIANIHLNNDIEHAKLFADFLIEHQRSIALRKNDGKLSNLALHRQKEIDNTRIAYIRHLIRLLSTEKVNYHTTLLHYIRLIPPFFQEFYHIFISTFGYLNHSSLITINDIFAKATVKVKEFLLVHTTDIKNNIRDYCKIDIFNENLLKQSYHSFSGIRDNIIASFQTILDNTIKYLEFQISNFFKELGKNKVKISDIVLAEGDATFTSKLRDTIKSINDDLGESSLFAKINTDFRKLDYNYEELTNSDDDEYLNQLMDIHEDFFHFLDNLIIETTHFLDRFVIHDSQMTIYDLKNTYNTGLRYLKNLDNAINSFAAKLDNLPVTEYEYLDETLKFDQEILNDNYQSVKGEFLVYEEKMAGLDQKITEYHQIIKDFTMEKLVKINRDNLNYGTANFDKRVELRKKEITILESNITTSHLEFDKTLLYNQANLSDSLLYAKKMRNDNISNNYSSYQLGNERAKNSLINIIERNQFLTKMANIKIDSLITSLNKVKREYSAILKFRAQKLLDNINENKRQALNNRTQFRKKTVDEDKKYQNELRQIAKEIRKMQG